MKKIAMIFALLFGLSSCMSADDVVIGDIKGIKIVDMSKLELMIEVENRSRRQFELREMEFTILDNIDGRELIKLVGSESVFIAKRSNQDVTVPLRFSLLSVLSLINSNLSHSDLERMVLRGDMLVKSGVFKRRIEFFIDVADHIDSLELPDIEVGNIGELFN